MKPLSESSLSNKRKLLQRAYVVAAFLALLAVAVFVKLIRVQFFETFEGKTWKEYAAANEVKTDTIPAMRGNIYARDSSLLATSLPYYYIGLNIKTPTKAYFNAHVEELATLLSRSFGKSVEFHKARLLASRHNPKSMYIRLWPKTITHLSKATIQTWPFFRREKGGGGGDFEMEYQRYKPFSPMADRTIGFLNKKDGKGLKGLEESYEKALAGKKGYESVEVVEGGRKIPVGVGSHVRPEAGYDIYTTLDLNIQDVAEASLRKTLAGYNAAWGCVVVMEVATGEIKAVSNLTLQDGKYEETGYNYAVAVGTDPGSTFKLATMMAVLEETGMDPRQEWLETGNGSYFFVNGYITDTKRGGHGTITAQQAFEKSSNIGTHLLSHKYFSRKPEKYMQYLGKFHLKSITGIHMKGEAAPFFPEVGDWHARSLSQISFGYEMRITPLQTLALYNAIANNGYWVRPMIVRQIRNVEEVVEQFEPYVEKQPICSPATVSKVRNMLEGVVQRGTATNIRNDHYSIAGKTGTAVRLIDGAYVKKNFYTSFAGYFPADKPKYSCIVVIASPKGSSEEQLYASSVAAPVFKQISDRIFATDLSLHKAVTPAPPKENSPARIAGTQHDMKAISSVLALPAVPEGAGWLQGSVRPGGKTTWKPLGSPGGQVPDVSGLSLRDALFLIENKGYRVSFRGKGKITAQQVIPDQKKVLLTLE